MNNEKHVYEIKLDRSLLVLLWALAIGLILNALPEGILVPQALAQLNSNPIITVRLQECQSAPMDQSCHMLDIDD